MRSAFFAASLIEGATMAEGSITAPYSVCSLCLMAINPSDINLLHLGCFKQGDHHHLRAQRVPVRWNNQQGRIERLRTSSMSLDSSGHVTSMSHNPLRGIRPLPDNLPPTGKRFILCDQGWRCRGESCSYAHSKEERDAWNEQLLTSSVSSSRRGKFNYGDKIGGK